MFMRASIIRMRQTTRMYVDTWLPKQSHHFSLFETSFQPHAHFLSMLGTHTTVKSDLSLQDFPIIILELRMNRESGVRFASKTHANEIFEYL